MKKLSKLGKELTNLIFLYEGLIYDSQKNRSFTVTNMLSKQHTTLSHNNWLYIVMCKSLKRQCVISLSAIVKSFTQYTSLQSYIIICADLLTGKIYNNSYLVPHCFMRIDIAHFIKICCEWTPLKIVRKSAREIILRSIGL